MKSKNKAVEVKVLRISFLTKEEFKSFLPPEMMPQSRAEQSSYTCVCAKSLQSCPTLCDSTDCGPPGSSVQGILQARILEWVAIAFCNPVTQSLQIQSCASSHLPWIF